MWSFNRLGGSFWGFQCWPLLENFASKQNYQMFANICYQIFLCKYFDALPLSHVSPCFFIRVWRDFCSKMMQGPLGLRPCAGRQLKCRGNIHQIATNILPDGWCVFGQLNMYNWGVKNAAQQPQSNIGGHLNIARVENCLDRVINGHGLNFGFGEVSISFKQQKSAKLPDNIKLSFWSLSF